MRPTRPLRLALDGALAALALVVSLGAMSHGGWDREELAADGRDLDGVGVGLALLMAVPLVGRRIAPLPVFAVVTLATGMLYGLGYGFPPVAFAIALFTAARRPADIAPRLHTAVLAASLVVLVGPSLVRNGFGPELLFGTLVWGGAWFAGDRLRQRGVRIAAEAEQARRAEREAERERRLASAEERTRIARDLHDSAGHAVSVILVQAGAARLLLEQDPARSRAALETIEEVARDTLAEIDLLVRALREEGASNGVEPPAGLAALDTLLARSRAAGLEPSVAVEGERRALAPAVDQAAYRILREALTNAARHGTGTTSVTLAYGPSALAITVENPLGGAAPAGPGHGLVGMRERASLVGGALEAAARDGRFRIHATLPYRDGDRA
jgi:signal transduction histidine kinase